MNIPPKRTISIDRARNMACSEFFSATEKFGPFASRHEGCAVIREEFEELWDAVKSKDSTDEDIRKEAVQLAAMSLRFLVDCCIEPPHKSRK